MIAISETLGTRHAELVVEIEEEVIEFLNDQLVEGDADTLEKIVHEVIGPPDARVNEEKIGLVAQKVDLRDLATEPNMQDVISGTIDGGADIALTEINGTVVAKKNGDIGKPIRLLNGSDEPGDGIRTTNKETNQLREGGEIDEKGSGVSLIVHFLWQFLLPRPIIFAMKNTAPPISIFIDLLAMVKCDIES